jgi:isochorismate hydrolase
VKTVIICGTLTNYCCESTARTAYFLNYHVVFGSDVNATDNALAHEGTIRTLRRGFARILDHKTIIRILEEGDGVHAEAQAARERERESVKEEVGAGASLQRPEMA